MSFGEDLRLFANKVEDRSERIFQGVLTEVHRSIADGSELTTAPGQPVDTGFLRGSWLVSFIDQWLGQVSTNVSYAPVIEEAGDRSQYDPAGVDRPDVEGVAQLISTRQVIVPSGGTNRKGPSEVGGPHSVLLTRAHFDRIVDHVTRIETGA